MQRWEYKTEIFSLKALLSVDSRIEEINPRLNEFGQEGWELVSLSMITGSSGQSSKAIGVFKRKIE